MALTDYGFDPALKGTGYVLSNNNWTQSRTSNGNNWVHSKVVGPLPSSGKLYCECLLPSTYNNSLFGVCTTAVPLTTYVGGGAKGYNVAFVNAANRYCHNNATATAWTGTLPNSPGDAWCFALDIDNAKIWFGTIHSGSQEWINHAGGGVGDPANGLNESYNSIDTSGLYIGMGNYNQGAGYVYTLQLMAADQQCSPPTGFSALDTLLGSLGGGFWNILSCGSGLLQG